MKKLLASALTLFIVGTPMASAQNTISIEETFDSVFDAFIMPEDGPYTAKWEAINDIKGVSWKWPLNQISQHKYTMEGTVGDYIDVKIYGLGYYDPVEFEGSPFIGGASISFGLNIETFEQTKYIDIDHFNPDQLKKIPTSCDEDNGLFTEAYYELSKPGKNPLYIKYEESFGTRMGNISYVINYILDDLTPSSYTNPCQVLK